MIIACDMENKIYKELRKLWDLGYNFDDFVVLMKLTYNKLGIKYLYRSAYGDIIIRHSDLLKDDEFIIVPAAYIPTPKVCKCCGQVLPK